MTELLSYETRGSGPGLVLLHGTGSTGLGSWGTVVEQLAADHTVVLPDLPGSGASRLPEGPLDIDTVTDQIAATASAAGLERFTVAGASLGAALAIKVAARHPERVRGLATVVGYAYPRTTLRLNLEVWQALEAGGQESVGKFLTGLTFAEDFLAALPAEAVAQIVGQFGGAPTPGRAAQIAFTLGVDVRDALADVRVPALVVSAVADRFVAPEHSAELAQGIAGARLVEVGGGHASLFEDPRQTADALVAFLATLG